MSTEYALAGVSAVLRHRLTRHLTDHDVASVVGAVTVTVGMPDRIRVDAQEANAINLCMHRVSRNAGFSPAGLPSRDASGRRVAATPLALDLHYVVSAYGAAPMAAEILLGHALSALHEEPVLTSEAIRRALAPVPPDPSVPAALAGSGLAEQVECLRVTQSAPSAEDVHRIWSAFHAPYRPSAYFEVSVVLVEPGHSVRRPLPVRTTGAAASPLDRPQVDDVRADGPPGTPVTAAAALIVTGRRLAGAGTRVVIGASVAQPADVTDTRVVVAVSSFAPPVRAGVHALRVVRDVALGTPPAPHGLSSSDAAVVALRPQATPGAVTVTAAGTDDGVQHATGTLAVGAVPPVGRAQRVMLLLNEAGGERAFSLRAPAGNGAAQGSDETATVVFAFERLPRGDYLVRLQVDGVDSPLQTGPGGAYDRPRVTV